MIYIHIFQWEKKKKHALSGAVSQQTAIVGLK